MDNQDNQNQKNDNKQKQPEVKPFVSFPEDSSDPVTVSTEAGKVNIKVTIGLTRSVNYRQPVQVYIQGKMHKLIVFEPGQTMLQLEWTDIKPNTAMPITIGVEKAGQTNSLMSIELPFDYKKLSKALVSPANTVKTNQRFEARTSRTRSDGATVTIITKGLDGKPESSKVILSANQPWKLDGKSQSMNAAVEKDTDANGILIIQVRLLKRNGKLTILHPGGEEQTLFMLKS